MGKVRAKTLGDEELELKERQETEARRLAKIEAEKAAGQAKKADAVAEQTPVDTQEEAAEEPKAEVKAEPAKKKVSTGTKTHDRSAKYKAAVAMVEKNKNYSLSEALALVQKTHMAKFDETVELHINTTGSVNGSVTLPHGTGKSTRIAVLAPGKDAAGADALLKEIEAGKINFDILVATPDAMPRLAKVARILGPKGLMPNPKNGTVTANPEAVAKQYEGGHMTFKTEAKAPVLHLAVGKLSFGPDKLAVNIHAALKAVDNKNIRNVTLKSTMSPGIKLAVK